MHARPSEAVAATHNTVGAYAEHVGALVVAEGIESERDADRARALGATVGQGWLFGRPAPLPEKCAFPASAIPIYRPSAEPAQTPFRSIQEQRPLRQASKRLLLEISRELERQADLLGEHAVLIGSFQDARHFGATQARLYGELSHRLAFVGALGAGIPARPCDAVRGAAVQPDDPLAREWNLVVVAPHFAAALTALDRGDTGVPEMERRFDFQLTYDRDLAFPAARTLLARIGPLDQHPAPTVATAAVVAGRSTSAS